MCVASGFRRRVNKISLFGGVTQRTLVVADVSAQPTGPIFKSQTVLEYGTGDVANYQCTLRNRREEQRSNVVISLPVEVAFFCGNKAAFCLIT